MGNTQLDKGRRSSDALTDLRANNNELSVWSVEPDLTNLSLVLTAFASNRQRLDKLDYMLLDEAALPGLSIKCMKSEGNTPHSTANATVHRDLVELTAQKVVSLALEMMPTERFRVRESEVKRLLLDALSSGAIDRTRIDARLLSELEPPTG